jgi:hypothetical protein
MSSETREILAVLAFMFVGWPAIVYGVLWSTLALFRPKP